MGDEGNPSLSDAHSAPASPAITTGRVEPVPACSPSVSQVRDDSGIVGTCPVCPNAAFRSVGGFLGHVNRHLVHRVPVPAEFWASQEVLQLCTGCGLAFQMRNKARVRCAKCRKAGTAISARPPCDDLSAPAPLAAVPGPPLSSFPSLDDIFRKPWPSVQRVPTSVRKGWARRYAKLCSDAAFHNDDRHWALLFMFEKVALASPLRGGRKNKNHLNKQLEHWDRDRPSGSLVQGCS